MSLVYRVTVDVEAPVQPTEVRERVADAVRALFPEADVTVEADRVSARTHSLDHFRERLFEQRILDTARREFLQNRTRGGFEFSLKKQAAFHDVVNFSVGNPAELGDIDVRVTVDEPDVEEFVGWLAPPTEDGEPVEP
jgi:hypothetical protein